jgi:hypothetical protein
LALIGFVLPESANGLIFITLCAEGVYVTLAFSQIGFVLHNHAVLHAPFRVVIPAKGLP